MIFKTTRTTAEQQRLPLNDLYDLTDGRISYSFTNNTRFDLVVKDRGDAALLIPAKPDNIRLNDSSSCFTPGDNQSPAAYGVYVREVRSFHSTETMRRSLEALVRSSGSLEKLTNGERKQYEMIHGTLTASTNITTIGRTLFIPGELIEKDPVVFERICGFMFIRSGYETTAYHPEGDRYKSLVTNSDLITGRPSGRLIEIVVKDSFSNEKYTFMGNGVVTIPVTVDPTQEAGVYVTEPYRDGGATSASMRKFYSFEEGLVKFGIYNSFEEAASGGNPAAKLEKELHELRNETDALKVNNERLKAENEEKSLKLKSSLEDRAHELKLEEQKFKALEHKYKQREHELKEEEAKRESENKLVMDTRSMNMFVTKAKVDEEKQEAEVRRMSQEHRYGQISNTSRTFSETMKLITVVVAFATTVAGLGFMLFKR